MKHSPWALPLILLLGSLASAQTSTCYSSTNTDSNGNPCTNFTTKGGFVSNGTPASYALAVQDGVTNTSTSSQGIFNISGTSSQLQTLMPIDPLFTLGYNVVAPYHYPANSMGFTSGNMTGYSQANGALVSHCGRLVPNTYVANFSFESGPETIDPPDANGNNTFTWNGTLSVPFTFAYCISSGGRGGHAAPVYTVGTGVGELSATPSIQ